MDDLKNYASPIPLFCTHALWKRIKLSFLYIYIYTCIIFWSFPLFRSFIHAACSLPGNHMPGEIPAPQATEQQVSGPFPQLSGIMGDVTPLQPLRMWDTRHRLTQAIYGYLWYHMASMPCQAAAVTHKAHQRPPHLGLTITSRP